MSIPNLPVNFKDDILASSNPKRKYQQTFNTDGSVSFEDVTQYTQNGSEFGASQVNQTNGAVNNIYDERILTLEELALVTEPGYFVDAMAVSDLNGKLIVNYSSTASETHETVIVNQVHNQVYVKTYELSSLPENGEKDYNLDGLSSARYIWIDTSMSYVYSRSDSYPQIYPFPYVSPSNVRDSISFTINNDTKSIKIRTGATGWTPYRAYIAVKYY